MIASGLTTGKAPPGRSALLTHGRSHPPRRYRQSPPQQPPHIQDIDIYDIARLRARDTNRITFIVSHWSNPHWNLVFADSFQVTADDVIEYVAWPPGWFYQPAKGETS